MRPWRSRSVTASAVIVDDVAAEAGGTILDDLTDACGDRRVLRLPALLFELVEDVAAHVAEQYVRANPSG